MNTSDLKSFHYLENGEVTFSLFDTIKSSKILEPGSYKVTYNPYPENRVVLNMDADSQAIKIHEFPDKQKIDNLFEAFFNKSIKEQITKQGFYHKVGLLLHGKEGTGKSTILKYYYSKAIKENRALVFHMVCSNEYVSKCWELITRIRNIQDNPIIVLFEEFEVQIENRNESFLKTVLDGNMSIDNCIFLATTNYIERIPEAIKNRPSRFKYSLNIEGIQNINDVYGIVNELLKDTCSKEEINRFTGELRGQSLDIIKQFCIDKIMGLEYHKTKTREPIGFTTNLQAKKLHQEPIPQ